MDYALSSLSECHSSGPVSFQQPGVRVDVSCPASGCGGVDWSRNPTPAVAVEMNASPHRHNSRLGLFNIGVGLFQHERTV